MNEGFRKKRPAAFAKSLGRKNGKNIGAGIGLAANNASSNFMAEDA